MESQSSNQSKENKDKSIKEKLNEAMARWWGRQAAIKSLIAQATDAQKQEILNDSALTESLASQLTRSDMLQILSHLKAPLKQRLKIAMTGWWRSDSQAILNLTANATDAEKQDILNDTDLLEELMSKLRHHDMLAVLNNLNAPLIDKLKSALGRSKAEEIVRLIEKATPAEKEEIANNTAILSQMMITFREDYKYQVVSHLDLLAAESFTNHPNNNSIAFTSLLLLFQDRITISKEVNFIPAGTFVDDEEGFEALMTRVIAAVTKHLSIKFKLRIESASAVEQKGDGEYPIIVKLSHNPSADYRLLLHGGIQGSSHVKKLRGHIYEFGRIEMKERSVPDIYLAHESAHLILGANDEYAYDWLPERAVYTDHSLMGDFYAEGIAAAEIKARHFQFLVPLVERWFPDRTIRIVQ